MTIMCAFTTSRWPGQLSESRPSRAPMHDSFRYRNSPPPCTSQDPITTAHCPRFCYLRGLKLKRNAANWRGTPNHTNHNHHNNDPSPLPVAYWLDSDSICCEVHWASIFQLQSKPVNGAVINKHFDLLSWIVDCYLFLRFPSGTLAVSLPLNFNSTQTTVCRCVCLGTQRINPQSHCLEIFWSNKWVFIMLVLVNMGVFLSLSFK